MFLEEGVAGWPWSRNYIFGGVCAWLTLSPCLRELRGNRGDYEVKNRCWSHGPREWSGVPPRRKFHPLPTLFFDPKGTLKLKKWTQLGRVTYDHLLPLHKRQCLVTIIFTKLPFLHPLSCHEMIFILVYNIVALCTVF